jgi:hypothetical protein
VPCGVPPVSFCHCPHSGSTGVECWSAAVVVVVRVRGSGFRAQVLQLVQLDARPLLRERSGVPERRGLLRPCADSQRRARAARSCSSATESDGVSGEGWTTLKSPFSVISGISVVRQAGFF